MNALKARAPSMREKDFRKIIETLFVKKPDGTVMAAVTRDMALDIDFDQDQGHRLKIVPDADVSSTPDGVPFCTFVVTDPDDHLIGSGFIYWEEASYSLRARIANAPYKTIVKDGDADGRNIGAMAAAMRYPGKSDPPECFQDEWKEDEIPVYVRRSILRTLSENGYAPSDTNVRLCYAETMRLLDRTPEKISPFTVNWQAFEDACLSVETDYGNALSDAFDRIEAKLETGEPGVGCDVFGTNSFADPSAEW